MYSSSLIACTTQMRSESHGFQEFVGAHGEQDWTEVPDFSQGCIRALAEGCHAFDMASADPADPPSVTSARDEGAALISKWIDEHKTEAMRTPMSNAANLFELAYSLGGYTQDVNDTLPGSGLHRTQAVASGTARYSNGNPVV